MLGVTPRSALLNVQKLVDAGIVREVSGRQRNRLFLAQEIIDLLQDKE